VLVQSDAAPSWDLPAGYLLGPTETKPFDLAVEVGQWLRFRLRANPTKRIAEKNPRLGSVVAGKRVGLVTDAERVVWLLRKAAASGFEIPGKWLVGAHPVTGVAQRVPNFQMNVISEGRTRNDKVGHRDGAFVAVRFEGVLKVTDPAKFVEAVRSGIGSAKGFGFGLLSVAPH
jgi:CRISPR system Cascade subunit CasE